MKLVAYTAASFQTLIAAGTFLVAKDAAERFTPLQVAWFRIVAAALIMGVAYAIFRPQPAPTRKDWGRLFLLGLLGVVMNQTFFLFGIHESTPLHASLLYALTPVFVALTAIPLLGERLSPRKALGVLLAVGGVFLVLSAQGLRLTEGPLRGDLLVLVAVASWSGYTLLGKNVLSRIHPFAVVASAFGFAAVAVLPAAPWVFRGFNFSSPGLAGWLELLYLAGITSGVAFTLWYVALRRLQATQLAVFNNLQAPITALLAWMILGSVPSQQVVIGGLVVLLGVTLVQIPGRRRWGRQAEVPAKT